MKFLVKPYAWLKPINTQELNYALRNKLIVI
jgi:hypothetical protein